MACFSSRHVHACAPSDTLSLYKDGRLNPVVDRGLNYSAIR